MCYKNDFYENCCFHRVIEANSLVNNWPIFIVFVQIFRFYTQFIAYAEENVEIVSGF